MTAIGRRSVIPGVVWGLGAVLLAPTAAPAPASAAASEAAAQIEKLYAALLGIMKQGRSVAFAQRYDAIEPVIDAVFDLPGILQVSVGPRWAGLPADEQAALLEAYRRYIGATYVANFDHFNGQRFDVQPSTRIVGRDEIVQSRIIPVAGATRELDYAMRQVNGEWRIVDVLLDGSISRVAVQRSDFRALTAGGSAALLASLRQKTADLQAGQQ